MCNFICLLGLLILTFVTVDCYNIKRVPYQKNISETNYKFGKEFPNQATTNMTSLNSTTINKPILSENRSLIGAPKKCEDGYLLDFTGECSESFNR